MMRTLGCTSGSSASEWSPVSRESVCTEKEARDDASVPVRVTNTEPVAAADTDPSTGVRFLSPLPSGLTDQTFTVQGVASSLAVNVMRIPPDTTLRTWRPAGVTGFPSTITLRAPSRSAHVTRCPCESMNGTPGTSSTHASSVSLCRRVVSPVAGSMRRASTARWSLVCVWTRSPPSVHETEVRYSWCAGRVTGTRAPSATLMTTSPTTAFAVPAAG